MKRFSLLTLSICACFTSVYSQLRVDSTGYVGVGLTNAVIVYEGDSIIHSPFTVCTVGVPYSIANFQSTDRQYTLTAYTERANQQGDGTAIWGISYAHDGNSEGVVGVGMSNSNTSPKFSIGVRGEVTGGYNSIGVYGGKYTSQVNNFAGIYGTTNTSGPSFQYPGSYAGYFVGTVRATGPMYAQAFYTPSANPTGGGNNENTQVTMIGEEENVTDKLRNVSSFELQHTEQATATKQTNPADEFLKGRNIQDLTKQELHQLDSICMNTSAEKTDPLSSVNYGLDAAQLKAVFPKLVQQDKEGNYSINYVEMVPLLVKSINEMSAKIEKLDQLLGVQNQARKAKSVTTGIEETPNEIDMVRMDQNKPNPFGESTVIGLNVPGKTQKASIFIYDLSGKQIQNISVAERGDTNITVYASDLGAGMYIYTLVVDGKVVVTRRMIVEK